MATVAKDKRPANATEMVNSPKRQKMNESFVPTTLQKSELDSAMALASLALDSPKSVAEREAGLSPKAEGRVMEAVPVTPITPFNDRKRVHFSSEVPESSTMTTGPSASRLIRRRRPMMVPHPRPIAFRPYSHVQHYRPQVIVPHGYHHPMMYHRPWHPNRAQFIPPQPPLAMIKPAESTWICDYCNSAAFSTYNDACEHEKDCRRKVGSDKTPKQTRQPEEKKVNADEDNERDETTTQWASGSIPLAVEPADREWLSELNCYLRKHCIDAFSAMEQDVLKTSKRGRISLHQVGIRCTFCAHRPLREKAVAAVSYPTSTAGIYESVKRWQRVHLPACLDVGDDTQAILDKLQSDNVWVPTTRQYWTDSARALGMVDTSDGIRFKREPSAPENWMPETNKPTTLEAEEAESDQQQLGGFICRSEDKDLVPPYVFCLMRQVEPCYFTEADRFVARSKGPVGFAGFQCRHCQGHAGLGKYFPLNSKALSTNSTSQNIHAHVLKCRKCPQSVKDELLYLKTEKLKSPRLVPGWRKTFFEQLWERLHGDEVNLHH